MRIGTWLTMLGEAPESAWTALEPALLAAAGRMARSGAIRRSDEEDFAQTAWMRLFASGGDDARRAALDTPLEAWCTGVLRNVALAEYRRRPDTAGQGDALESLPGPDGDPDGGTDPPAARARLRLDEVLARCSPTAAQREAYELVVLEGLTCHGAAKRLGIDRKSVWERLKRLAVRAAKSARGDELAPDLSWVASAVERSRARGDERGVRVFELHRDGESHRVIAEATGLAPESVATKIQRARRRHGGAGD